MARNIVFIDSRVADYQTLVAGLDVGTDCVLIDAGRDGVAQMQAALFGYSGLESIQVVSHGSAGTLLLGTTVLDQGTIGDYLPSLKAIGQSLTEAGDLLLYGCDVATGETGQSFIAKLAGATGADVAASTNPSGAAALGGDWVLERHTGIIEAAGLLGSGLSGLLAVNSAPTFTVGDGKVTTDFSAQSIDSGASVTVQSDGKILVAGTSASNFALARYNANGSLDTSFAAEGKVTTDFGLTLYTPTVDAGRGVTLQDDGKILVAGTSNSKFALVRYDANGSLDTTFDTDGKLTTDFALYLDFGQSVTFLTDDDKILVAGYSNNNFALARYNANGSLDVTFDTDGMLTTDFGSNLDNAYSVTVQSDHKILVAGTSASNFALARYNIDGSLDLGFDTDGKVTTEFGPIDIDYGQSVTVQTDGKILVAGTSGTNFALARYDIDGSLDLGFDGDGKVTTDFGASDYGQSVTLQKDGKILVAGYTGKDFALARYNTDGSLDTSFDGDGKLSTDFGLSSLGSTVTDCGYSVTVQSDGKILVAGSSGNDFALARYNANGSLDASFSPPASMLDAHPTYSEQSAAVVLDPNVAIFDAQLAAFDNYRGATLTLSRQGVANAEDIFSAASGGSLSELQSGSYFSVGTVAIGQVLMNAGGTLSLAFNYNASQALVNSAMGQIAYANTSDTPEATVLIAWVFSDGNIDAQGIGGALKATGQTTVNVRQINDVPTLVTPLLDQNLAVGSSFSYTVAAGAFSDLDSEPMTYSISGVDGKGLPPWMSFNFDAATRTFSGTPGVMDVSTFEIRVTAQDAAGASASDIFILRVSAPSVVINGTSGNNSLVGGSGDDQINGLAGNDTLDGGAGNDTLLGGDGSDLYHVRDAGDLVTETNVSASTGGIDTAYTYFAAYTLTANVENGLIISGAAANLTGNGLDNVLYAGAGNNLLDGDAGSDTVSYADATAAISASLASTAAQDTEGSGIDILRNIENLSGSAYDDTLTGNSGANILNGGKGADMLLGRDGSDIYYVDNAGDVVFETNAGATGGVDIVYSYLAVCTLTANVENGRIVLATAANLTGNALDNTLYAGAGNNVLSGNSGTDTVSYAYAAAGVTFSLDVATAQATGGSGSDILVDIEGLTGSNYNDRLSGNSSANVLDGGRGNDTLAGGLGNDSYVVNTLSDVVTELVGEGADLIQSAISFSLVDTDGTGANGGNVENLQLTGTASINGTGNSLNNVIYANSGINGIDGGAGIDTVSYLYASSTGTTGVALNLSVINAAGQSTASGLSGADLVKNVENITGSSYNDTLTGNTGANVLDGGAGIDTLTGGDGSDTYYVRDLGDVVIETNATTSGGADTVYSTLAAYTLTDRVENGRIRLTTAANLTGNTLNNVLYAGAGNNVLDGVSGVDTVSYVYATAAVSVSLAISAAQVTGGSGSDTLKNIDKLIGSNFHDRLNGDDNANTLDGLALNDALNGGGGNDLLLGGDGSDLLIGGLGKDTLTGGAGNDTFTFKAIGETTASSTTCDVITDFVVGDRIDLSAIDANTATASVNDAFTAFIASTTAFTAAGQLQLTGNVLYGNTDTDSAAEFAIVLMGVTTLTTADFVL